VRHQPEPKKRVIYGHSLGGAIAIELALRRPEATALIVESTFTSIAEMAKSAYWMFPADWLLNQRFDALAKVPMLRMPVLFIHGTADTEVPYAMSEQLFNAARGSKWLTLIPGGGHEDSAGTDETLYTHALLEFTQRIQPPVADPDQRRMIQTTKDRTREITTQVVIGK
jgi:hypothetical protein